MALSCPKPSLSSTFTSTPSTRFSTGRAAFRLSPRVRPSSRCRRSALTDHGSLAGAIDLVREAKKHGVKPMLGCEVYVADDRKAQRRATRT